LSWSSKKRALYGSPAIVDPAFFVATKQSTLEELYLYPTAINLTPFDVVASKAKFIPPGQVFSLSSSSLLGKWL